METENKGLLDQVDARTNLAGSNKMEILLFSLGSGEKFGINVFKVKEVCPAGKITRTPNMPSGVDGIVSLRGHVMPVPQSGQFHGIEPGKTSPDNDGRGIQQPHTRISG